MFKNLLRAAVAVLALTSIADAAEPGATPVPQSVIATIGCWAGHGDVMGKQVTINIVSKPIVQDAMLALDAQSVAALDAKDIYAAHLIFGGSDQQPGATSDPIIGFWADSFGGAFTASGAGQARSEGFDITYRYSKDAFVNRWRISGDRLTWQIVAQDKNGVEKPFANYSLARTECVDQ